MSQHDLSIANQGFPAFRSDLNDALQALGSLNSGATAPSTTFANMLWYDTANNLLKMRNEDNDAWVTLFEINQTTDVADIVRLAASQTLTNKTLTTPVINGFTGDTSVVNIGSGQLYKDTSGNLGVNTSSPSIGSGFTAHKVKGTGAGGVGSIIAESTDGASWVELYSGASTSDNPSIIFPTGKKVRFGEGSQNTGTYTDRFEVDANTLSLVGLKGVKFQATQSASSDANTLDDYEEGTYAPTLTPSSSGSYTSYFRNEGVYTKIGRTVNILAFITVASGGSSSPVGTTVLMTLPFTPNQNCAASVTTLGTGVFTPRGAQVVSTGVQMYIDASTITWGGLGNDIMVNVTYTTST